MGNLKLRDFFTIMSTIAVIISSIIIVLTFLGTYHFIDDMSIFNSYFPLQVAISVTMAIWGVRFFIYKRGIERYIYSIICILISIVSIYFIISWVR